MTDLRARGLEVGIGEICVVAGLDLEVKSGQFWGLLGRNGVGKTTLLNCLAGLVQPLRGQVLVGDTDVHVSPRRQVARRLGMLEQHTVYHFDATVQQIALTGRHPYLSPWEGERDEDFDIAEAALRAVDLAGFDERGATSLSGGEARRLAMAALLVQEPGVMLLDEPTNHLDLAHQARVMKLVLSRVRGSRSSALAALHDVNLACRYCSHVLLLFGDGAWRAGPTSEMLSVSMVERLYDCPVEAFEAAGGLSFFPRTSADSEGGARSCS